MDRNDETEHIMQSNATDRAKATDLPTAIARLRELDEAASPKPWTPRGRDVDMLGGPLLTVYGVPYHAAYPHHDANLVASMRNTHIALLAVAEAAETWRAARTEATRVTAPMQGRPLTATTPRRLATESPDYAARAANAWAIVDAAKTDVDATLSALANAMERNK